MTSRRQLRPGAVRSSVVAALVAVLMAVAPAAPAAEVGDVAPAFDLPGLPGAVTLAKSSGKIVYLDFWASWCGPCRQSFPWMNALTEKLPARDFQIIAVNLDTTREDADRFLAAVPAKFTLAFDPAGATPRLYGVKGMPTSVLIGRDGRILLKHAGFNNAAQAKLEAAVMAALKAAPLQ